MKRLIISAVGLCGLIAAGAALAKTTSITQAGQAFSESDITVSHGDSLKFENNDDVNHNILVSAEDDDDDAKDLGVQPPGGNVTYVFDKAGKFKVRCHIHPAMRLTVTVQ